MKKSLKILSLALIFVFALGIFAVPAVKAEEEVNEDLSGTVRYAYWDTNQDPWLEKTAEAFNEIYPILKCP